MRVCERCGRENAEDARFCQACGQPLEDTVSSEERKLVSVLFVDVVGSTAQGDRADPEDLRDVLRVFYEIVREQVERFDGAVEKFTGDAVVAVFGAPLAHGDDAERAVRAGLAALEAISAASDLALEARAAVNTGEAVVSLGTDHERGEHLATGDVLNTASRLQSAASPGRLIVGADTYRATRRAIRYTELEPIEAKVKRVAGILETDMPDVAHVKLMRAVTEIVGEEEAPEIGRFLSLLLGLGLDQPSDDRLPLFFAVRRLIEGLGSQGPTIFVFEDLHWAETSQIELLEYLCSHVRDVPVAFLALARPEFLDTRPTWGSGLLAQTTIPLEPLSASDAAGVAAATLGSSADGESTVARLVEIAGGNPLFLEELAASIAEGARGGAELPATVREAIASRIDILPPAERAVLLDASVIGKTFWRGVLRSIGPAEGIDTALDALEARDLI